MTNNIRVVVERVYHGDVNDVALTITASNGAHWRSFRLSEGACMYAPHFSDTLFFLIGQVVKDLQGHAP